MIVNSYVVEGYLAWAYTQDDVTHDNNGATLTASNQTFVTVQPQIYGRRVTLHEARIPRSVSSTARRRLQ